MDLLTKLFHNIELAMIGAIGALVSLKYHPDVQLKRDIILFIITGAAIAYFTTGLVGDFFSVKPERAGAIGFLLGAFGASLVSAAIRAINAADLWALVKSKFGGGSQ